MKFLHVKYYLQSAWTVFWVTVFTGFFGLLAILFSLFERKGRAANLCGRLWAGSLFFVCGVRYDAAGLEHIEQNQNYIVMANHQSGLDIPLLFLTLPLQIRMMAKKELFRIPVFGWALSLGGYIKIHRSDREKAIAAMDAAARRIRREQVSVVIFPEGTRSPDGTLQEFKKGGFMFALQTGLPVLPVTIRGTHELAPKKSLAIQPGSIELAVHEAVDTGRYSVETREELIQKVRSSIQNDLDENYV
ncbi:MAG: 1-acylglycerol-3-phosphate O-acyltransferase [Candidatus Marinimicrobia bacterium]|nr:1-acylglycerol-3-phosphate O-acyltransferase [Candidatus Neomarinimicrobiota bacterium]